MKKGEAWAKYVKGNCKNRIKGYGLPHHGRKQYRKSRYIKARKRFVKRAYDNVWADTGMTFDDLWYITEKFCCR